MAILLTGEADFEFDAAHRAKKLPMYGRNLTFRTKMGET
jgi:hypothetical protein